MYGGHAPHSQSLQLFKQLPDLPPQTQARRLCKTQVGRCLWTIHICPQTWTCMVFVHRRGPWGFCPQTSTHMVFAHRRGPTWSWSAALAAPPSRPQESPGTGLGLERPHTVCPRGLHADGEGPPQRTHGNRVAPPHPAAQAPACGSRGRGVGPAHDTWEAELQPSRVSERPLWRMAGPADLGRKEAPGPQKVPCRPGRTEGSARQAPGRFCRGPGAVCCPKEQRRKAWNPSPMSLPGFLSMMPGVRGVFP